jgi:hypothetical protein
MGLQSSYATTINTYKFTISSEDGCVNNSQLIISTCWSLKRAGVAPDVIGNAVLPLFHHKTVAAFLSVFLFHLELHPHHGKPDRENKFNKEEKRKR